MSRARSEPGVHETRKPPRRPERRRLNLPQHRTTRHRVLDQQSHARVLQPSRRGTHRPAPEAAERKGGRQPDDPRLLLQPCTATARDTACNPSARTAPRSPRRSSGRCSGARRCSPCPPGKSPHAGPSRPRSSPCRSPRRLGPASRGPRPPGRRGSRHLSIAHWLTETSVEGSLTIAGPELSRGRPFSGMYRVVIPV
jgi:hypothetical protein